MNKPIEYQASQYKLHRGFLITIYQNECFVCKSSKSHLEIHHVNAIKSDNSLKNLVPVCSQCHGFIHQKNILITNVLFRHLIKIEAFHQLLIMKLNNL